MSKALRLNEGKPELDFILDFPIAMEAICRVMELGAVKYERGNWKKGGKPDNEYYAAALRHLFAAKSGEPFAHDSGCSHLAHAAWNILALIEINAKQTHHPDVFKEKLKFWAKKGSNSVVKSEN